MWKPETLKAFEFETEDPDRIKKDPYFYNTKEYRQNLDRSITSDITQKIIREMKYETS